MSQVNIPTDKPLPSISPPSYEEVLALSSSEASNVNNSHINIGSTLITPLPLPSAPSAEDLLFEHEAPKPQLPSSQQTNIPQSPSSQQINIQNTQEEMKPATKSMNAFFEPLQNRYNWSSWAWLLFINVPTSLLALSWILITLI
ncbi:1558_t:CDS:1, partial [Ambispora leptoticha]